MVKLPFTAAKYFVSDFQSLFISLTHDFLHNIVEIYTILSQRLCPYNFRQRTGGKAVKHIIDYSPLWKTMSEKSVSQYHLLKSGIDNKTLDSLKKNKNITLLTVEKICRILDCTPNDIVEFKE